MKNFLIFLVVAAVAAGAFFLFQKSSDFYLEKTSVQIVANDTESFTSPEVEILTSFNAWFLKFTESGKGQVNSAEVRFKETNGWSSWKPIEIDKSENDDLLAGFIFIDQLVNRYQFRITISGDIGYKVSGFQIETQNTLKASFEESNLIPVAKASIGDVGIISRSAWGANADYLLKRETTGSSGQTGDAWDKRITACDQLQIDYPTEFHDDGRKISVDANGKELQWPETFSKEIKKIIIHHTSTDEGKDLNGDKNISIEDVEALLRAVYYYHAIFRGWGDIGYHYLIDPLGNVYEGRNGGDKVIGAHAYCANTGTIGISFIGNYSDKLPATAALNAGVKLLGELSNLYDLRLAESSKWHGKDTRNLVGHRDYAATACPGNSLYSYLPELASRADIYATTHTISESNYAYSLLQGDTAVTLNPLEEKSLNFQIRNNGKLAFPAGSEFQIEAGDINNNKIGVAVAGGVSVVAKLNASVASGETVTVSIPFAAKMQTGTYQFGIMPVIGGQTLQKFNVVVKVSVPISNYSFINAKHPPQPFAPGEKAVAWVELKNTSNFTWKKAGENRTYLGALKPQGVTNLFTEKTEIASLDADTAPGQTARFEMNLEAPTKAGRYIFKFAPAVVGYGYLPDYGMQFNTTVRELRFAAEVIDKTKGSALRLDPAATSEFFVKLKNTSQFIWDSTKFSLELLQNSGVSIKADALKLTSPVAINGEATISFPLTAAAQAGKYRFSLRPRYEDGKAKTGDMIDFAVEVNSPSLTGNLKTNPIVATLNKGETQQVTIAYLNTGNVTWNQKDVVFQRLPANASSFVADSWLSALQPAVLAETIVKPNEVGHFTFTIQKNTAALKETESFAPMVKGLGRIRGSAATITLQTSSVASTPTESASASTTAIARPEALSSSLLAASATTSTDTSKGPTIRIRLSFVSDEIDIGGGKFQIQKDSKVLFTGSFADFQKSKLKDGDFYRIVPVGNTILEIPNWQRNTSAKYNYNKFRGILEIRRIGEELVVIDELPLETYLHGIAEPSPKDPDAKQEVMTLLTRSYAYYYTQASHRKFPGKPYDGSDSPAEFQQYLGYNYEILSNFPKWVEKTQGKILTYNGNSVKTPYFTSSSGKTKSAADAGWNSSDFAFVKVVEDPWSCGLTSSAIGTAYSCPDKARGHGVGLSGNGAAGLAKEGKTYLEIINYFYQGLVVTKVY